MNTDRPPLSPTAARLLCERYGVQPKGDVVESPADERFGPAFTWGVPAEALQVEADQAAGHSLELAAELATFDHYCPQEKR
ncbi:hypothetical protein E0H75_42095 [Kribbella capetownensis]|uniref:Uncharacterized protein n=1 Tax=Kribbella capetownensis TaxID=1572659 RepID=A0A4R0IND3_9ACTN|nr:hypothetical protein [Kribbella capetownensis]TCC33854.1 hypothetical protein E0H75_42095 [Kribbella capetownensis]